MSSIWLTDEDLLERWNASREDINRLINTGEMMVYSVDPDFDFMPIIIDPPEHFKILITDVERVENKIPQLREPKPVAPPKGSMSLPDFPEDWSAIKKRDAKAAILKAMGYSNLQIGKTLQKDGFFPESSEQSLKDQARRAARSGQALLSTPDTDS